MKTHIHTPPVPCLYFTGRLLLLWISVVTGSLLCRVNQCQRLQTHKDELLLGRWHSNAASRCTVEANAVFFIKLGELGKALLRQSPILMNTVLKQMPTK